MRTSWSAFSVTTAHHLDIGSNNPGSVGIVDAVDAYAEGLQFKSIKVYEDGRRNDEVWTFLDANIRVSDLVVGDMEAQIAACHIGAARYVELLERYGAATVRDACEDLFDYSERLMRRPDRRDPRRRLRGRRLHRRLPRRRVARAQEPAYRRHGQSPGQRHDRRSDRHGTAGRRPADQHALRGDRRRRHLADPPLGSARHRHRMATCPRTPASTGRSRSWRPKDRSPIRYSRRRRSPGSAPATWSRTRS